VSRVTTYFKGAFDEIRKVTWPTRKEAFKLTFSVIVFALVFAMFTSVIDFGINELFNKILLKG